MKPLGRQFPTKGRDRRTSKLAGMKLIRGREFLMGSEQFYPEERPVRRAQVGDFWIDERPVTNQDFAEFVEATGHLTLAEIPPDPRDYPDLSPEMAYAGSAVFQRPVRPVAVDGPPVWWAFVAGASWRRPLGPGSSVAAIMDHPVVQVSYADASAYATWAGKALPTEAEWEFAARGGAEGESFAWGDELAPGGRMMANYWQGAFPLENTLDDGWERTSPVGCFPPNGFGLFDMIGNVWEWTSDGYAAEPAEAGAACCGPPLARSASVEESFEPNAASLRIGRKVLKGGSHLCAANYCQRYRPAARHAQAVDSPTSHIGFRCVARRG